MNKRRRDDDESPNTQEKREEWQEQELAQLDRLEQQTDEWFRTLSKKEQ